MEKITSVFARVLILALAGLMLSCASPEVKGQQGAPEPLPEPPAGAYYEYLLGYEAELSGDWDEALKHYNEALRLDPSSYYLKTQMSYIYLRTGRVQDAIKTMEDVARSD